MDDVLYTVSDNIIQAHDLQDIEFINELKYNDYEEPLISYMRNGLLRELVLR
jgi:hypothetical protein